MSNSPTTQPTALPVGSPSASESLTVLDEVRVEVGDTSDNLLLGFQDRVWARYADKARIAPRLQELYTKRTFIDMRLARAVNLIDTTADQQTTKLHQITLHLQLMRVDTQTEIDKIEARARASCPMVSAALTATAPVTPPLTQPINPYADGNQPQYRGDIYSDRGPGGGNTSGPPY